jgi:hypothetical protein
VSLGMWESYVILIACAFLQAFLIALIKKTCVSHMFKGHVSFLYVSCKKFLTNQFVRNFYPVYTMQVHTLSAVLIST